MTDAEYADSCRADCKNAAIDCKTAADYASYNFEKGNDDEARRYVAMLKDRVAALNSQLASLDYALRKPTATAAP